MDSEHRARRPLADSARRLRLHRSQTAAFLLALRDGRKIVRRHGGRSSRPSRVAGRRNRAGGLRTRMDRLQRRPARRVAGVYLLARHLRLRLARNRSADRHAPDAPALRRLLRDPSSARSATQVTRLDAQNITSWRDTWVRCFDQGAGRDSALRALRVGLYDPSAPKSAAADTRAMGVAKLGNG